jgi:hypothetical protein
MARLDASLHDDIVRDSYELATQAKQRFEDWRAGRVYIPKAALRAMGRRYLHLRDREDLSLVEVYEFGRLFAFFALVYPPDGDIPSPADVAIDFCNLLSTGLPISAPVSVGEGG